MLRRNVLIFHNAALGDFLLTWPIALAAGRVLAQSRIIYVTASHKGRLAERAIGVEYNDIENGWHGLHADAPLLGEIPRKMIRAMQLGIVFSQARDDRFIGNLQTLSGDAPMLHLSPHPPAGVHVWRHQLDQLAGWPVIRDAVEQIQNMIRTRGLATGAPGASGRVAIHPGSGAARKNWPIENFVEVALLLKQKGREVVFLLGEVERERFSDADLQSLRRVATIRSCETILDLHESLCGVEAYLGNDSGPTHLASMLGRRVAAMFGPTSDPAVWGPPGPRVTILPFEASPEDVVERLTDSSMPGNL